jgi:hypothetical protein
MPLMLRGRRESFADNRAHEDSALARAHEGPYLADTVPSNTSTWATVTAPGAFYGEIETIGDQDWVRITMQAGVSYTIALNSQGGSTGLNDPYLAIYDSTGTLITVDDDSGAGANALIVFTPTTSGTYYLGASGIPLSTGWYALVVNGGGNDPIAGTTATTSSLVIDGATASSSIEAAGDQDWFRVNLVAGESYAFTLDSSGATPLSDAFLRLYDASGTLVSLDDDGGSGLNSMMQFTAVTSGVYYLAAGGETASTGAYTIGAAHGPPQDPLDTIDLGFTFATTTIDVYFALEGAQHGPMGPADDAFSSSERASVMSALQTIANVTNLTFNEVTSASNAEIIFMLSDLPAGVLAQTYPGPSAGYVEFSPGGTGWNNSGLTPGGLAYSTIIHEVLHALGLEHPHHDGGEIQVMQGVIAAFDSYGTFGLNQQVFTVMSYNDGWALGPGGVSSDYGAGHAATPMALDIALLQQRYGAPVRNQTNTTYMLSDATSHSAYRAIWDTAGIDAIAYGGSANAVINLNAATLLNEAGGGGFVSYAGVVLGGYTIAHGVVIENAAGGGGNDEITGNGAANLLTGAAGADVLRGNDGNDYLDGGDGADQMLGGSGDDVIVWDGGDDLANVQGGADTDTLAFVDAAPTSFDLTAHGFERAEQRVTDAGGAAWASQTTSYDNAWRADFNVVINDDGAYSEFDWDQTGAFNWSTNWVQYDALSRADLTTTVFDTGVSAAYDYDQASTESWVSNWNQYAAGGALDINVTVFDSGVETSNDFDPEDLFNWESNWISLDALGQLDLNNTVFDDGVQSAYDFDQTDAFVWSSNWNQYAAGGALDINVTVFDDGASNSNDFDEANAFDWASSFSAYVVGGAIDLNITIYDNGNTAVLDYDQDDAFTWATIWQLYDSNGVLIGYQGTNDDGSLFGGP